MSNETNVRRKCWRGLGLAISLGLLFAQVPPSRAAERPKFLTAPDGVFLGLGGVIDRAQIGVGDQYKPRLWNSVSVILTLEERRTSGQLIFLGRYTSLLSDTTIVTTDGPDGRTLVELVLDPSTEPVNDGSRIEACVLVVEHRKRGDVLAGEECRELTPIF